jgi:hypothetical protein
LKNQDKNKPILLIYILLKKKQTYINYFLNNKKIFHSTNGIILKKNLIIEKSRKKDSKTSILNITTSINILKNLNLNIEKKQILINVKKIKPFLNKINKILKTEFNFNDTKYIITPEIPFNKNKFKKIKSIKRRLRKKYNILDV